MYWLVANSMKSLASKETHRLKLDNNLLSTHSALRKWPLGGLDTREDEIFHVRPRKLLGELEKF